MVLKYSVRFYFLIAVLFSLGLKAQETSENDKFNVVCIGFYNLENLFDTIDTEGVLDEEFTPTGSKQWNSKKYYEKLDNLAKVIAELGVEVTPKGVAVLGVAEIENKEVLEDLVKNEKLKDRNYKIVHHHSPDRRGVDVAFLYRPDIFELESYKAFTLINPNDTSFKTRDQLLMTGKLKGERVHLMVAHWPSRRGGQKKSSPLRELAADLGKSVIDSILKSEPNAKIIYMGDLNDDPVNKSLKKHMLTESNIEKVEENELFNPMESLYNKGIGTLAWRDTWNLFDQILLSPQWLDKDYATWKYYGVKVFNKNYLKQATGNFKGYPYRTYVGPNYMGGYSDHFPVYIYLVKQIQ